MYLNQYVVWIISHSEDVSKEASEELQYSLGTKAPVIVRFTPFSDSIDEDGIKEWANTYKPDAVVLLLEKEGLSNQSYRNWVEWSLKEVSTKDHFRMFVHFQDMTLEELHRRCDTGVEPKHIQYQENLLLYHIRDTVQLEDTTLSEIGSYIFTFLKNLPRIKEQARMRKFNIGFSRLLGWAAYAIQILSAIFVTACTAYTLLRGRPELAKLLSAVRVEFVAILSTILYAPLVSVPLYMLSRGNAFSNKLLGQGNKWGLKMAVFIFLGMSTFGIPETVHASYAWIILGVLFGVALDTIRRNGRQAHREKFALKEEVATTAGGSLPKEVRGVCEHQVSNPLYCPFLSKNKAKVFISYTHSSPWAQKVVDELRGELVQVGAECFLDKCDISPGTSWRRRLHTKMADANVFISVTDEKSIHIDKKWPSAEMETALAGKYFTGQPEMLMLVPPGFSKPVGENVMPVYNAIFESSKNIDGMIRIIEVGDKTVKMVASAYKLYHFSSTSVLSPLFSGLVNMLNFPLSCIGPFSTFFGLVAWVLFYLDRFNKVDMVAFFGGGAFFLPTVFLTSFLVGFSFRLVTASMFEVNMENIKSVAKINIFSLVGLVVFLALFRAVLSPLALGWAALLVVYGIYSASFFIDSTSKEKKDFLRKDI